MTRIATAGALTAAQQADVEKYLAAGTKSHMAFVAEIPRMRGADWDRAEIQLRVLTETALELEFAADPEGALARHEAYLAGFFQVLSGEAEGDPTKFFRSAGDAGGPGLISQKPVYPSSPINRRRATKADMAHRRHALMRIVGSGRPMTVRQVFYAATVRGLIEKTERGYHKIAETLTALRKSGEMPYGWLADSTRWMRKPKTHDSVEAALEDAASSYRKALWTGADDYVEIWLEKDALAGVVAPITQEYDVPLMVARGYSSLSFLHSAAEHMTGEERPCFIYHLGDHDPSGVNAAETIGRQLEEMAPNAEIYFDRVAVTAQQIRQWNLPSRPTKTADPRSKRWTGGESVELDALSTAQLQGLVRGLIEKHLDAAELKRLRDVEEIERETFRRFAESWRTKGGAS